MSFSEKYTLGKLKLQTKNVQLFQEQQQQQQTKEKCLDVHYYTQSRIWAIRLDASGKPRSHGVQVK